MKFNLYQINLTDAEYENLSVRDLYLDTTFRPSAETIQNARSLYKLVATIEANSFEHCFEIGNIGPFNKITRKAPMHSVSVGDVLVSESGIAKFCDLYGFGSVKF